MTTCECMLVPPCVQSLMRFLRILHTMVVFSSTIFLLLLASLLLQRPRRDTNIFVPAWWTRSLWLSPGGLWKSETLYLSHPFTFSLCVSLLVRWIYYGQCRVQYSFLFIQLGYIFWLGNIFHLPSRLMWEMRTHYCNFVDGLLLVLHNLCFILPFFSFIFVFW